METLENIGQQALELVEAFFAHLGEKKRAVLPPVLGATGLWTAGYDGLILAVFRLDEIQRKRIDEYKERTWPPFPAFLIAPEPDQPASHLPVAFSVQGKCHYFSGNQSSSNFAFGVGPGSSFTVVNHLHEFGDMKSGKRFKYHVPLAFVLGVEEGEQWPDIKSRLSELLEFSLKVWKTV